MDKNGRHFLLLSCESWGGEAILQCAIHLLVPDELKDTGYLFQVSTQCRRSDTKRAQIELTENILGAAALNFWRAPSIYTESRTTSHLKR